MLKIPFEALIDSPSDTQDFTQFNYLIKNFEISYHYSATLYLNSLKSFPKQTNNRLVAFAPIFRKENSQISANNKSKFKLPSFKQVLASLARDRENFDELPYSEYEVREIIESFKKNGKEATGYLQKQASEENFKKQARNARYVHVASHSFANEEKPGLSGIAFSQPADSTAIEDGILYSGEIYNLDLNAELVVLSSCKSGIGKLVKGEGMLAITRGFLFASTQNILFSLWNVADKPTSELMIEFYKQLLSGMNYSQALRETKLKFILKSELTALPWKWSGFVLIGK